MSDPGNIYTANLLRALLKQSNIPICEKARDLIERAIEAQEESSDSFSPLPVKGGDADA